MTEELKNKIKKTIELLKPIVNSEKILQEKYFARPPFSFLQRLVDIIISKTGFGKGLFTTEELKKKDAVEYHDRDFKEVFLNKIIDLTCISLGEAIPSQHDNFALRIAAGMEPENTNRLLHMLARCVEKRDSIPWKGVVTQVLNGAHAKKLSSSEKSSSTKPTAEMKKHGSSSSITAAESTSDFNVKKTEKRKDTSSEQEPLHTQHEQDSSETRPIQQSSRPSTSTKQPSIASRLPPPKVKTNEVKSAQPVPLSTRQQKYPGSGRPGSGRQQVKSDPAQEAAVPVIITDQEEIDDAEEDTIIVDKSLPSEHGMRPSSKQKQKGQLMENLVQNRKELIEKNALDAKPDDNSISGRTLPRSSNRTGIILKRKGESKSKGKTEPSTSASISRTTSANGENDPRTLKGEKGPRATEAEFERLRQNVQVITRSTNPIGKMMDNVQEDLEAIQREFENWRKQSDEEESKLAEEQQITDQQLKSLQSSLLDVEQQIVDRIDKINSVKSDILRNDKVVERLLQTVTSSN